MKHFFLIFGAAVLAASLAPAAAPAQVVVNPAALRQLAGIAPAAAAPGPIRAAIPRAVRPKPTRRRPAPTLPAAMIVPPGAARAAMPAPADAARPPPARPPAPLPALQPVAVDFPPGSAALPQGAAAALKAFCGSSGDIAIDATAPGDPANPSVAMRLSLSRAFAVRDALTACGVPATRILPRALGDLPGKTNNVAQVSEAK